LIFALLVEMREATYAARGVLMLDAKAAGVVADFGGGSLEFARIETGNTQETVSLPLGAYRVEAMGVGTEEKIQAILWPYRGVFGQVRLYAIGGSWRSLCKNYAAYTGHQADVIPSAAMISFCRFIETQTPSSLQERFRIETPRARLAPIAAFVLRVLLETMEYTDMTSSTAGVRDGLIHEFLSTYTEKR
jgi:exopolyphosphatase / guanosine-5'-triphosphate,3'-diphosphate pyrophosphatase